MKTAFLSLVTFMTLKIILKLKIDNDIHPRHFCHPVNDLFDMVLCY